MQFRIIMRFIIKTNNINFISQAISYSIHMIIKTGRSRPGGVFLMADISKKFSYLFSLRHLLFSYFIAIHADGDNKNNLYFNELLPERFGRVREYALGKTSGKANILKNLEVLGIDLDEAAMRKVTERVVELSDKKELVTVEDLPYIVADVLRYDLADNPVRILNYSLSLAQGLRPVATLKIEIHDRPYEQTSAGDGQYDAFMRALRQIYREQLGREFPMLRDYAVSIPPGGRTDAFVQTIITWEMDGRVFKTRGLDADQTEAAIKATIKMLNIIEPTYNDHGC